MIDWLHRLDLSLPGSAHDIPAEKIDQDDEQQSSLFDFESGDQ